jgi:HPt (histidine-containing phosphotransfer) domain-containing protein
MQAIFIPDVLDNLIDSIGAGCIGNLLEVFVDEFQERCQLLQQASTAKDYPAIKEQIHALKSTCAGVGLMRLQELAQEIETASQLQNWKKTDQSTKQFLHEAYNGLNALKIYTDSL